MKKLIHAAVATACLSMLAGCLTPAEIAERRRMQQDMTQDKTCRGWGLKPGTDAYANCRLDLSRQQSGARHRRRTGCRPGDGGVAAVERPGDQGADAAQLHVQQHDARRHDKRHDQLLTGPKRWGQDSRLWAPRFAPRWSRFQRFWLPHCQASLLSLAQALVGPPSAFSGTASQRLISF
jgi:hypothetical protein